MDQYKDDLNVGILSITLTDTVAPMTIVEKLYIYIVT